MSGKAGHISGAQGEPPVSLDVPGLHVGISDVDELSPSVSLNFGEVHHLPPFSSSQGLHPSQIPLSDDDESSQCFYMAHDTAKCFI